MDVELKKDNKVFKEFDIKNMPTVIFMKKERLDELRPGVGGLKGSGFT